MDLDFLNKVGCYFAGGTAIAMAFGEKRLSFDIDFLASDLAMKAIRNRVISDGLSSIFNESISVVSESRSGYSIKGIIRKQDGDPIKLEIVHEARVLLHCVAGLISEDQKLVTIDKKTMLTQKILAMCDRGLDAGFHSRDYWDFCILAHNSCAEEITKAYAAACDGYTKQSVDRSFLKVSQMALKNKTKGFDFLKINVFDQADLLLSHERIVKVLSSNVSGLALSATDSAVCNGQVFSERI
jgi:hypothetical protein